ncbi:hypothetical protein BSF38_03339 [Paludisphaera borealis]|uniref:Uncharacterized protein n=1 Tax=Paludisphaera borealis TaxID=1387353 RepID=A0A1U7CS84_9BACT|nr:hypothetical protein BSF38_03339 [Paludisphaera borealis]
MNLAFPKFLLDEIPWNFDDHSAFPSRGEFEAAVFRNLRDVRCVICIPRFVAGGR